MLTVGKDVCVCVCQGGGVENMWEFCIYFQLNVAVNLKLKKAKSISFFKKYSRIINTIKYFFKNQYYILYLKWKRRVKKLA